jgi:predicted 3-demethylubiquinone-9 3-methyltransferase (glyoxalase superfamily)
MAAFTAPPPNFHFVALSISPLPIRYTFELNYERSIDMPKITPFLWYETQAEEAANFYVSIFPNSKIIKVSHYSDAGPGRNETVMVVQFELDGKPFLALNGGPHYKFTEAVSFTIDCKNQQEVDHYWQKLTADGGQESMCGWLKDKYGLSWQVTPAILGELISDPDKEKAKRAMEAMLKMKKIDIATIQRAKDGK